MLRLRHALKAVESVTPPFRWPVSISWAGQVLAGDAAYDVVRTLPEWHLEPSGAFARPDVRRTYVAMVAHYAAACRRVMASPMPADARNDAIAYLRHRIVALLYDLAESLGERTEPPEDPRKTAFINNVLHGG